MNKEELKKYLPHREPMLLLDDCTKVGGDASIGHYKVRGDEYFVQGHFPGQPIVPGVILCEMMAQSSCVILSDGVSKDNKTFFAKMDNVKFRRPVVPGDLIELKCKLVRKVATFYTLEGEAYVDGALAASGTFTVASVK